MKKVNKNLDANVVNDFGQEWKAINLILKRMN